MTETATEGLFGDLGLNNVSSNPNETPDGVYKAVVHEAKMFTHSEKKPGENKFFIITYKIVEPEPIKVMVDGVEKLIVVKDNTVDEWKSANPGDDSKKKSFLKQRIVSLGVPEDVVNKGQFQPRQIVGVPVLITVKNKDGYTNVKKVVLADDKSWEALPASGQPNTVSAGSAPGVPDIDF